MGSWKFLCQAIDVVEVAVALIFMLVVLLVLVVAFVVESGGLRWRRLSVRRGSSVGRSGVGRSEWSMLAANVRRLDGLSFLAGGGVQLCVWRLVIAVVGSNLAKCFNESSIGNASRLRRADTRARQAHGIVHNRTSVRLRTQRRAGRERPQRAC